MEVIHDPAYLVTTSQDAGNMTADLSAAMTAPGSLPSVPMDYVKGGANVPGPQWTNTTPIPVSNAPGKPRPARSGGQAELPVANVDDSTAWAPWKEM